MLETNIAINKLFDKLKSTFPKKITFKTHAIWKMPSISSNSTIGEQIKYYRRLANIKQTDLSKKLNCGKYQIKSIENKKTKLANLDLLKAVLKELHVEDKIKINDDYLVFLLNDSQKSIQELRKKLRLTRLNFANKLGVPWTSIKNWETGRNVISRKNFEKIKKYIR